jgi:hypothetical protein
VRSRNRASDSRHGLYLNRIATHDFLWRKIDAAIHRLEDVDRDLRKIGGSFSGCLRLVDWFVLTAAGKREQRASPRRAIRLGRDGKDRPSLAAVPSPKDH